MRISLLAALLVLAACETQSAPAPYVSPKMGAGFDSEYLSQLAPVKKTTAVTKSDSTDTTNYCTKGIWVGVAGNVGVVTSGDDPDGGANTLAGVASGTLIPGSFSRIMSTNTDAGSIVCFGGH